MAALPIPHPETIASAVLTAALGGIFVLPASWIIHPTAQEWTAIVHDGWNLTLVAGLAGVGLILILALLVPLLALARRAGWESIGAGIVAGLGVAGLVLGLDIVLSPPGVAMRDLMGEPRIYAFGAGFFAAMGGLFQGLRAYLGRRRQRFFSPDASG